MNWYKDIIKYAYMRGRQWTPEELNKIKQLLEEGKGYIEIGKMFGVSETPIQNFNKKYKWRTPRKTFKPDEETIKKIDYMYALPPKGLGYSKVDIAKQLGVSYMAIKHFFNKTKRPTRNTGEQSLLSPKAFSPDEATVKNIDYWYAAPPNGLGYSQRDIAKQLGINTERLRRFFERTNRPIRGIKEQALLTRVWSPSKEQIEELDMMYLPPPEGLGMSILATAKELGINPSVLNSFMQRTGRYIRSLKEQGQMDFTRKNRSNIQLERWDGKDYYEELCNRPLQDGFSAIAGFIRATSPGRSEKDISDQIGRMQSKLKEMHPGDEYLRKPTG